MEKNEANLFISFEGRVDQPVADFTFPVPGAQYCVIQYDLHILDLKLILPGV